MLSKLHHIKSTLAMVVVVAMVLAVCKQASKRTLRNAGAYCWGAASQEEPSGGRCPL
jgi:hypothetical protein